MAIVLDETKDYYGLSEYNVRGEILSSDAIICRRELKKIFNEYDEYQDFDDMIELFAEDNFFKAHFVARIFLKWQLQ